MNLKVDSNYCILSNKIDNELLKRFDNIPVLDSNINYNELKQKLEFFPSKRIIFKETFYNLKKAEIKDILNLLNTQSIKYINITSNVEETLLADEIMVLDGNNLVLEGKMTDVLKEEKLLKKLGFGLPFVVDLSTQLNYYDIFDKIYYDIDSLVGDLWN